MATPRIGSLKIYLLKRWRRSPSKLGKLVNYKKKVKTAFQVFEKDNKRCLGT